MPPLNRVVAFLGPYISLAAGSLATYLFAKLNVLGVPGLTEGGLATDLTAAITFVVTTLVTWLGQASWLRGHHIELQRGVVHGKAVKLGASPIYTSSEGQASSGNATYGYLDRDTSRWTDEEPEHPPLPDAFDKDPDMGEPLDATPESYVGDPRDKHGAKDHPA